MSRADLRARWIAVAVALVAGVLTGSGCYQSHPCGHAESCNDEDDDCDGRIDEDFLDDSGRYTQLANCGVCGVDCREVFPTASQTRCNVPMTGDPICELVSCAPGFHRAGAGACAPDVPVLCLPCVTDADCALRIPGAACVSLVNGERRCGQPCAMGCPAGFTCAMGSPDVGAQCIPTSGLCDCTDPGSMDAELACIVRNATGHACAGAQRCTGSGLSACEPVLVEACNGSDDDCDGQADEDFRDAAGRYVSRLHCGACARPCVEPGPHMVATCSAEGMGARCDVVCAEGFVDVNRIAADGCECERFTGEGPPPVVGGDSDCDGAPDDTTDFVYVTTTGSDTNPGSLAQPMRTIPAAIARGRDEGKAVLVSRGIYAGPVQITGGVNVFGGYSPDFRDRDLELYPVLIERRDGIQGLPPVECHDVRTATRIEGFTVQGTDATRPGDGSTAIYSDGCGPEVTFASIVVLAGRGAAGASGDDSSTNLMDWGLRSLDELAGTPGSNGGPGNNLGQPCGTMGGSGGAKMCPGRSVSGGSGGAAACGETGCVNGAPCGNAGCVDFTVGGVCDIERVLRLAVANPAPSAGAGPGGGAAGELSYNAPTDRGVCNFCDDNPTLNRFGANGGDGTTGGDGGGGDGCRGAAPRFDATTGLVRGGDGGNGTSGTDGSGGGGASAGAGYDVIGGTGGGCADQSGGSGGGGGSGGCGAPGADGGTGGGASLGVLVRLGAGGTGPRFEALRVVTASGGIGGDGGIGASGGAGGSGGTGGNGRHWCARQGGRGGDGGRGGAGGGGGGGCGGGSNGIYIVSGGGDGAAYAAMVRDHVTVERTGVAGTGGVGGFSPGVAGTPGQDGAADPIFIAP